MAQVQEYVVRVSQDANKKHNIMRFSSALNVDVSQWTKDSSVTLEKEVSAKEVKPGVVAMSENLEEMPRFGAGSEFGKIEREEARIRKYTPRSRKSDEPWVLKVGGKNGKRYKGIREGGVSENASYYVFFQAKDGAFEAVPVNEWYNFTLQAKYKALTAEEAEEQYDKLNQTRNFFAVMKGAKKEDSNNPDEKTSKKKKRDSRGFKVTEMDEWGSDSEAGDSDSDDGGSKKPKKGAKKGRKSKKKNSDDDLDSEPGEESDEGDFDTREVDYISDSSSEEEEIANKDNSELKGVADEEALRQLAVSDSEEEDDDENKDKTETKPNLDDQPPSGQPKKKEDSDSSDSDSEDSDLDEDKVEGGIGKAIFLQKKNGTDSDPNSRSQTPISEIDKLDTDSNPHPSSPMEVGSIDSKAVKRRLENTPSTSSGTSPPAKKLKPVDEGVSESSIRRYLMRKPMTAKELFKIFKKKVKNVSKHELVSQIANVLKQIQPHNEKIKGELYLSIKSK